jgi:hypothetical protein
MHLHGETVDLSLLPEKGRKLVGAGGRMAPQDASAAFGRETMAAAAEVAVKEVAHRLANRGMYRGHGRCLTQGLWRQEDR